MSLFHHRIIAKHASNEQSIPATHRDILESWNQNLEMGIYNSETKNDGQFIQRILVDVLGYTESSGAGEAWTATKNHPVGKGNVDVALGHFTANESTILAPFELKGAKTRDLDAMMAGRNKTPVEQAWEYAMDAKGAKWVLVSNYREIRLYAVGYGRKDYELFELSKLTQPAEYARFMLLLSAENLLNGRTLSLLKESEKVEKEITDQLYKDYKALRAKLIATLTAENPGIDPLEIIQHAQTILDRILFIAFAEDKGLLPKETLKNAYETQNHFNPQPVWENFKGLFHAIDKGSPPLNITGYNGGLFAEDNAINSLHLSDEFCEGFKKIGDYDFESDVSVNILGHIFEQSITDLEEIKAHATGEIDTLDKKKSKRKKDGIFYTPPYITRYIVEQAVGGWLNDRKAEIGFDTLPALTEEDYASIQPVTRGKRKGSVDYNAKIAKHIAAWQAYKEALSTIKILDPACGSGAFLNEVFDYLKREGEAVNSQLTELNGGQMQIFRWDTHILANNIYGVDINRESVEITKLSLWLKTANKGEKLTYLDNNIKCGNSLIDDPEVAGELAFNWSTEFADIMQAGGFDVVVGNPPYGVQFSESEKEFLKKFDNFVPDYEVYYYFISKALTLMKNDSAYQSFIFPNTFLSNLYAQKYRLKLSETCYIKSISDLSQIDAFRDASVRTIILTTMKSTQKNALTSILSFHSEIFDQYLPKEIDQKTLTNNSENWMALCQQESEEASILERLKTYPKLNELFLVSQGYIPYRRSDLIKNYGDHGNAIVDDRLWHASERLTSEYRQEVLGKEISRYHYYLGNSYVKYGKHVASYVDEKFFTTPRVLIREITADKLFCCYVEEEAFNNPSVVNIISDKFEDKTLKYLTAILNSLLIGWLHNKTSPKAAKGLFPKILINDVRNIPIVMVDEQQQLPFIEKAEIMLAQNKALHEISSKFLTLLQAELAIDKLSKKLQTWYELEAAEFLDELKKKKITLSLAQKSEWMTHFEAEKAKALAIKTIIDTTDREIDQMVYELYNLTPEEIAIVEGSA